MLKVSNTTLNYYYLGHFGVASMDYYGSDGSFNDLMVWGYRAGEIPIYVYILEGVIRLVALASTYSILLAFVVSSPLHRYPWMLFGCWMFTECIRQTLTAIQRALTLYAATARDHYDSVFFDGSKWFYLGYRCLADGIFLMCVCWTGCISYRIYKQVSQSFQQQPKNAMVQNTLFAFAVPLITTTCYLVLEVSTGVHSADVYLFGYDIQRLVMCVTKWILEVFFVAVAIRVCMLFRNAKAGAVRTVLVRRALVMIAIISLYLPGTTVFFVSIKLTNLRNWLSDCESVTSMMQAILQIYLTVAEWRHAHQMNNSLVKPLLDNSSDDDHYQASVLEERKSCSVRDGLGKTLRRVGLPSLDDDVLTIDDAMAMFLRTLMIPAIFEGMHKVVAERCSDGKKSSSSAEDNVNHFRCLKSGLMCKKVKIKDGECRLSMYASKILTSQFAEVFTGMEKGLKIGLRAQMTHAFEDIRNLSGIKESEFQEELKASAQLQTSDLLSLAKFTEGRGGGFFCFSASRMFMIKTLPKHEFKTLKKFVPNYLNHLRENPKSLLVRLLGCYEVKCSGTQMYIVAMSNIFRSCDGQVDERYDLKGSYVMRDAKLPTYDRCGSQNDLVGMSRSGSDAISASEDSSSDMSSTKTKSAPLGLDLDFKRNMKTLPVGSKKRSEILSQLRRDCEVLCSQGIMDYSLLVGVWRGGKESLSDQCRLSGSYVVSKCRKEIYFIGIIDVLQTYDVVKRLERYAKVHLRQMDGNGVSVAPPSHYADRFVESMKSIIV